MNKMLQKVLSSRRVRYLVVPGLCILYAIISAVLYASPVSVTSISQHRENTEQNGFPILLTQGESWSQNIKSNENNLGIVSIHFGNKKQIAYKEVDKIRFELRNIESKKLIYQNEYRADLLQSVKYFPVGFPRIPDSQNKEYTLIFTSLSGNNRNSVIVDPNNPMLLHYVYKKGEILKNTTSIINFVSKKLYYMFTDKIFMKGSVIYLTPLIIYGLFLLSFKSKIIFKYRKYLLLVFVLIDIFISNQWYFGNQLIILLVWILVIISGKLTSITTNVYAIILLLICFISQYFGLISISNNSAVWCYYFLVMGLIQSIYELHITNKVNRIKS